MKQLKPYMIKFDKVDIIKLKIYSLNCVVRRDNQ